MLDTPELLHGTAVDIIHDWLEIKRRESRQGSPNTIILVPRFQF